jgi:hypothetical protein
MRFLRAANAPLPLLSELAIQRTYRVQSSQAPFRPFQVHTLPSGRYRLSDNPEKIVIACPGTERFNPSIPEDGDGRLLSDEEHLRSSLGCPETSRWQNEPIRGVNTGEQSLLARRGYCHGGPYDQTHGGHHCHLTERTNRRSAFAGDRVHRPAFGRPTKITAADCIQIFVAAGK